MPEAMNQNELELPENLDSSCTEPRHRRVDGIAFRPQPKGYELGVFRISISIYRC